MIKESPAPHRGVVLAVTADFMEEIWSRAIHIYKGDTGTWLRVQG